MSVVLCSFVLMSVRIIDDLDLRYNFAFWYIIANLSLITTNTIKIGKDLFFRSIPIMINKLKFWNHKKSHEKKIKQWLEDKKLKKDKDSISKEIHEHAETIEEIRCLNEELYSTHQKYDKHVRWL